MGLIKFLKGTEVNYNALENKNEDTFYITEENFYLGSKKINSGSTGEEGNGSGDFSDFVRKSEGILGTKYEPWKELYIKNPVTSILPSTTIWNNDSGFYIETKTGTSSTIKHTMSYNFQNKYFSIEDHTTDDNRIYTSVKLDSSGLYFNYRKEGSVYSKPRISVQRGSSTTYFFFDAKGGTESCYFYPDTSGNEDSNISRNLGKNDYYYTKWDNIYTTNGNIVTSDRNEKINITELIDEDSTKLIYNLKPVKYKMKRGTSGRTHWGFISQDIEELLEDLGWSSLDFAGFIKSPKEDIPDEYNYSLRYDEFISPMIKVIQSQKSKIDELESEVSYLKTQLNYIIDNMESENSKPSFQF